MESKMEALEHELHDSEIQDELYAQELALDDEQREVLEIMADEAQKEVAQDLPVYLSWITIWMNKG